MRMHLAALADSANLSADGKLNILGVLDRVRCERFPEVLPDLVLVTRFQLAYHDGAQRHELAVQLVDEDGHRLAEFADTLDLGPIAPGDPLSLTRLLPLRRIRVLEPQLLDFVLLVNGERQAVLNLEITAGDPTEPGSGRAPETGAS